MGRELPLPERPQLDADVPVVFLLVFIFGGARSRVAKVPEFLDETLALDFAGQAQEGLFFSSSEMM